MINTRIKNRTHFTTAIVRALILFATDIQIILYFRVVYFISSLRSMQIIPNIICVESAAFNENLLKNN